MAIENMAEYFGCDASEIFEERERAEGYLAGVAFSKTIHDAIHKDYSGRHANFREGLLDALREHL